MENITFEQALNRLDEIVKILEKNEVELDNLLDIYQEGIKLCHFCNEKLENVQTKLVEIVK